MEPTGSLGFPENSRLRHLRLIEASNHVESIQKTMIAANRANMASGQDEPDSGDLYDQLSCAHQNDRSAAESHAESMRARRR